MTRILSILLILFLFFSCMDPGKKRPGDEGTGPKPEPRPFVPRLHGQLNEISGLMVYDSLLWGFNDSGGKNRIYGFDRSGGIRKEIKIEDARNRDWEAIAHDEKHIYIGDFGNNRGNRKNLRIYKIDKKDIGKKPEQIVKARNIDFSYANQETFGASMHNTLFDCEAMAALGNNLYLFSKDWVNQTTTLYRIPAKKGNYSLQPVDTFNVNGLVTGAGISPSGNRLALVGYRDYMPFIWLFSNFPGDRFFAGEQQYFQLDSLFNAQTEGISFPDDSTLLVSCERNSSFRQQVFVIDIKKFVNGAH